MAEVRYGQPCTSTAPDGAACAWSRSHKNDHRDATSNGRCWTGGIRTAPRWRCPRGGEYAPCGTCPTCVAKANPAAGPQRIQLRRTKGWRKPEGAIVVARPSKWGNPFAVGDAWTAPNGAQITITDRAAAVGMFASHAHTWSPQEVEHVRAHLAGHDLACWCPLDQPCHADVLLELANGGGR